MAAKDVSELIAKEFVTVKIDFDRGIGAKDIQRRLIGREEGLPWFAFLDIHGKCLISSNRPTGGNIGHPFKPEEVAFFKTMLQTVKRRLSENDIDFLIQSLEAFNKAAVPQAAGMQ
jgi:hypothetical protein